MARRFTTWFLALSVGSLLPATLPAQDPYAAGPHGGYGPSPYYGPPTTPAPPLVGPPHGPAAPYVPPPPPPWVSPPVYSPPGVVPGVGYYGPDGVVTRQVPHEESWDTDGPIERFIMQVGYGAYFRLEYLHWNIHRPGAALLGAPLATVPDPRQEFPVFDLGFGPQFLALARVPDLSNITFNGINGLRAVFGMELTFGEVEFSGFALARASDEFQPPELGDGVVVSQPFAGIDLLAERMVATSLLEEGRLSDLVLLYNESFVAAYTSEVWGAQTKVTFDAGIPGEGYKLQPLVAARLLHVRERLLQTGVFDDRILLPAFRRTIDSQARNTLLGVMPGLRLALDHRSFSLGVEPRIGMGLNFMQAAVTTDQLRTAQDPTVRTSQRRAVFSPMGEVSAFLHVHLTESFTLLAGYDLLWAGRVSRPHDNILYNDNGLAAPPGVVVHPRFQDWFVHGLTVGGELRFR